MALSQRFSANYIFVLPVYRNKKNRTNSVGDNGQPISFCAKLVKVFIPKTIVPFKQTFKQTFKIKKEQE